MKNEAAQQWIEESIQILEQVERGALSDDVLSTKLGEVPRGVPNKVLNAMKTRLRRVVGAPLEKLDITHSPAREMQERLENRAFQVQE